MAETLCRQASRTSIEPVSQYTAALKNLGFVLRSHECVFMLCCVFSSVKVCAQLLSRLTDVLFSQCVLFVRVGRFLCSCVVWW